MDQDYAAVARVLGDYFDGLYHSDSTLLSKVFHPEARYVSATGGTLLHLTMAEYFPLVDRRPSPASRGEARTDSIISIAFAVPVTAFARVTCSIHPKAFTDFLTLIRLDGEWRIIAKVFHYDLVAEA
ncbi:MAG: nuclear transport factor 2 family protein [Alphaproteobacteria bacterium]